MNKTITSVETVQTQYSNRAIGCNSLQYMLVWTTATKNKKKQKTKLRGEWEKTKAHNKSCCIWIARLRVKPHRKHFSLLLLYILAFTVWYVLVLFFFGVLCCRIHVVLLYENDNIPSLIRHNRWPKSWNLFQRPWENASNGTAFRSHTSIAFECIQPISWLEYASLKYYADIHIYIYVVCIYYKPVFSYNCYEYCLILGLTWFVYAMHATMYMFRWWWLGSNCVNNKNSLQSIQCRFWEPEEERTIVPYRLIYG